MVDLQSHYVRQLIPIPNIKKTHTVNASHRGITPEFLSCIIAVSLSNSKTCLDMNLEHFLMSRRHYFCPRFLPVRFEPHSSKDAML